ncbi:hypothetical protein [Sorangium sp. So ce233]|uniref:hypothetical protein n=1 Tax=Sorangium sp. So ce233 TaxID=3133290 RepID=UPI003F5F57E2
MVCAIKLIQRLLTIQEHGELATVCFGGLEFVGSEGLQSATDRARSMRERLVAELERALDPGPVTSRRGAAAGGR